jgi:hypothetical protein
VLLAILLVKDLSSGLQPIVEFNDVNRASCDMVNHEMNVTTETHLPVCRKLSSSSEIWHLTGFTQATGDALQYGRVLRFRVGSWHSLPQLWGYQGQHTVVDA